MEEIRYGDLSVLELIAEGGYGYAYLAQHARFGTVVYKELRIKKLGERYLPLFWLKRLHFYNNKIVSIVAVKYVFSIDLFVMQPWLWSFQV